MTHPKYEKKALSKSLVQKTWSNLIENENDYEDDWTSGKYEVLVVVTKDIEVKDPPILDNGPEPSALSANSGAEFSAIPSLSFPIPQVVVPNLNLSPSSLPTSQSIDGLDNHVFTTPASSSLSDGSFSAPNPPFNLSSQSSSSFVNQNSGQYNPETTMGMDMNLTWSDWGRWLPFAGQQGMDVMAGGR
ncbi:hypothetical protein E1B28_002183 [Marasmius oreades]|uniref:Uncharacterized protein n=1 Tax=Marasmius oreades TaxID=181124 RepID=A0A9P7RMI9_9AGAR|nr:uncharacterized protein E1B28_002183 [Marasmius oreades]KAG7086217.1 hypothetical protein E1B28_002183 [Marasmius oreades]